MSEYQRYEFMTVDQPLTRKQLDAQFQERFRAWVQPHMRRPALLKRLVDHQFPLPEA